MLQRPKDIAAMVEYWDLTDNIVEGVASLRAAGTQYLPKFSDEDASDYAYRLRNTKLTNIYRDTVENLAAKPFEQEVTLAEDEDNPVPESLLEFIENVDGSGNNLTVFSSAMFFNGINSAIDWVLIDFDKPGENVRTVADVKASGKRPYWSHVLARNVIDVKSTVVNGQETLIYVKILEPGSPDRVRIFERMENGSVVWSLFEKTDKWDEQRKTFFHLIDEGALSIPVIPMVPFFTGRRDGRTWRFFPAMRDAADLQIELYQEESALKFAKNLTAYPMLAGNGVRPEREADGQTVKKIRVGPNRVLYAAPNSDGSVGSWSYVEPNASSLKFLAEDIKDTMKELRELGRQPLTAQSGNLTVITTAVAAGKARSAVAAWSLRLKDALENALVITCMWLGIKTEVYDPTIDIYTEFDQFTEGKDIDALNAARSSGDISRLTYWEEMKRRGVFGDEFTSEREEQRLLDELPGDGPDNSEDGIEETDDESDTRDL